MQFRVTRSFFSGRADLIEETDRAAEIVREAVQRNSDYRERLKISLISSLMADCPEERRFEMRKHYRRGVERFFDHMFDVKL